MSDSLERLFSSVQAARERDPALSRTSKLFRDGVQKMAKKLAEEAIEVGLDAVQMNRDAVVLDPLYVSGREMAREQRVLAEGLKESPAQRGAVQVDGGAEHHMRLLIDRFLREEVADLSHRDRIP